MRPFCFKLPQESSPGDGVKQALSKADDYLEKNTENDGDGKVTSDRTLIRCGKLLLVFSL